MKYLLFLVLFLAPLTGMAANFDGVSDKINLGSDPTLDNMEPFTISAWTYWRSLGGGSAGAVFAKDTALSSGNWYLRATSTGTTVNALEFVKNHATSPLRRASSNNFYDFKQWVHVTLTWDGTSSASGVTMYKNCTQVPSYRQTLDGVGGKNSDAALNLYIGSRGNSVIAFDGLIEDVKIYNRVLTPAEVRTLCKSNNSVRTGLIYANNLIPSGGVFVPNLTSLGNFGTASSTMVGNMRSPLLKFRR